AALARRAAAAERCVVGTWGGSYAHLLSENIGQPILKPKGVDVIQSIGDEAPRVAKLVAERRLPRSTFDIACMVAPNGYRTSTAGLVEKLDTSKVPNLAHVLPSMHIGGFMPDEFVPQIWSPQVLVYNPTTVKNPPTRITDLLDPRWKGKVGVVSENSFPLVMGVALAVGGNPDAVDKAKQFLLKLNKNGLRIYPETDSLAPAFKSGEIEVGIIWLARTVMWQNEGFPVQGRVPEEGAIVFISGMVMPKNAPNKAAAYKYLNALLEPSAQIGFAEHMGYLPTVNNVKLTGRTATQLGLPKGAKLVHPDYAKTAKLEPEMNDWFLKHIERR
ncbi:MAG: ABC transporter substrate-binding protein, partial [Acetobacteraceae bacterium]